MAPAQSTCSLLSTEKETMMVWRGDEVIAIGNNSMRSEDCPLQRAQKYERNIRENKNIWAVTSPDDLSLSLSDRLAHTCE
jgi:hypothetical protein